LFNFWIEKIKVKKNPFSSSSSKSKARPIPLNCSKVQLANMIYLYIIFNVIIKTDPNFSNKKQEVEAR
jgi:hypothetical protein